MTTEQVTHVQFLIDRSGSMSALRRAVIDGFNGFIEEQKTGEGTCVVTLHQFDRYMDNPSFETLFEAQDVHSVRRATLEDFVPRGMTPLYDAMGKAILWGDERSSEEDQILVIISDGQENASAEYTKDIVFDMVKDREAKGRIVTFLGANQDAYASGAQVGVSAGATQSFSGDSQGMASTFASVSAATSSYRSSTASGQSVKSDDFYSATGKKAEEDHKKRSKSDRSWIKK